MGLTKTEKYSQEQIKLAQIAKALGHPARMAIVQHLLERQECICNDLVEELPLSQSTISQHLRELKNAGLIKGNISGPKMCYCIDREVWKEAENLFQNMFDKMPPMEDCC